MSPWRDRNDTAAKRGTRSKFNAVVRGKPPRWWQGEEDRKAGSKVPRSKRKQKRRQKG
jgi:hypothetical protein